MRANLLAVISMVLMSFTYAIPFDQVDDRGKNVSFSINFDGLERSFTLYLPDGEYEKTRYPLVIVLHGGGSNAKGMLRLTESKFNEIADREGAYIAYPEGVRRHWNEGRDLPLSYAHRNKIDDVGFIRALINTIVESHPIDSERIFVTGMSNGGLMSYKLACAMPDVITAIAPVNASIPQDLIDDCKEMSGPGLMVVNGTEDPQMPYYGGEISVFGVERGEVLSTQTTIDYWLKQNECPVHSEKNMMPDLARKDETTVTRYTYSKCGSGSKVVLYRVEGGGHTWPGGRQYLRESRIGRTSRDINACEEIWSFFSGF